MVLVILPLWTVIVQSILMKALLDETVISR
jgi:hypothetical protein